MIFAHIFTTLNRTMRRRACAWLFFPRRRTQWHTGTAQEKLKTSLNTYLFDHGTKATQENIQLFYNARSALYHGIRYLDIGKGDEIILQGYTCVSVSNAIIATGASPVYADICPDTLNIDPQKIATLITPNTKAILIQHTFGIHADIKTIQEICLTEGLALIEDCCHALGMEVGGKKLGTFGDISIFSFGRDKIISSVNGGVLLINTRKDNYHPVITRPIGHTLLIKNFVYIILGQICKVTYSSGFGKFLYYLAGKYKRFPDIVTTEEKQCNYRDFNRMMPNALADIALEELKKIDHYNTIRKRNSLLYDKLLNIKREQPGILRYLYLTKNPQELSKRLKSQGILLGDRYQQIIAPKNTNYDSACYILGSCPIAESLASQSVNLPNHSEISEEDVKYVVGLVKKIG